MENREPHGSRTWAASARTSARRSPGARRRRRDVETGLRIAGALLGFWTAHALFGEGERFAAALLDRSRDPTAGRARALTAAGFIAGIAGDVGRCRRTAGEALTLAQGGEEWYRALCLNLLGTMARYRDGLAEARRLYGEALTLATRGDLWWPTALAWANLGALAELEDRHREAVECHERCVAIARASGDGWMTATGLANVARAAGHAGDVERAVALHGEALRAFVRLDNPWGIAVCIDGLARQAADRGHHLRAARLYGAEEAIRERAGIAPWPTIRAEHEAGVQASTAALGEPAWARARMEGRALSQAGGDRPGTRNRSAGGVGSSSRRGGVSCPPR